VDSSVNAPASLRALLADLIDYAGLFPPAALPMQQAVENYARYLTGPDAWALARFILPVSRFAEFEAAIAQVQFPETWCISALLGSDVQADIRSINEFNHQNSKRVDVDTVEVKAESVDDIHRISALIPKPIVAYFEIPTQSAEKLLPAIHDVDGRAKIRMGGVTPDAVPTSETVARFISECAEHSVAFKATAGLHHPVRCVKPLTFEPNATTGTMHGFLNVFMAATGAERNGPDMLSMLLDCNAPKLEFTDQIASITAEGERKEIPAGAGFIGDPRYPGGMARLGIPTARIRDARQHFAISFGSCSFEEPLADLRELKLL
jgi:hypothetical protein